MNALVRSVLDVVYGPQEAHHGLILEDGEINLVFYTNYGRILGRDHEWVQDVLTVTVAMFRRMRLETNLEKTKSMVFMSSFV